MHHTMLHKQNPQQLIFFVLTVLAALPKVLCDFSTVTGCDVPGTNWTLGGGLTQPYYLAIYRASETTEYRMYLSLCKPLSELPEAVIPLCDSGSARACVTKVSHVGSNVTEAKFVPNAGTFMDGSGSNDGSSDASNLLISLVNRNSSAANLPSDCQSNGTVGGSASTTVRLYCLPGDVKRDQENRIFLDGWVTPGCSFQVYWMSRMACQSDTTPTASESSISANVSSETESHHDLLDAEEDNTKVVVARNTCVVRIPGYDAVLDLSAWSAIRDGYYVARSLAENGEHPRLFHLNLCAPLRNSSCPESAVVCELEDTEEEMKNVLVSKTDEHTVSYSPRTETIHLEYPITSSGLHVNIEIHCDRDAAGDPQVSLSSANATSYTFRFLTRAACLVPPVQCLTEDNYGNIYDLSALTHSEYEFEVSGNSARKYKIKVCGSLVVSRENPCQGQAGVCTYHYQVEKGSSRITEAYNLGIMSKRPFINSDGTILVNYDHGDVYDDGKGNKCSRSVEITFICTDREFGPMFVDKTECKHQLQWKTAAACPQSKVSSRDCTVREPLYHHEFNLTALYNSSQDWTVITNGNTYVLNVCGTLHSTCENESSSKICFDRETELTYTDGNLQLEYSSKVTKMCQNRNLTLGAKIFFLCHQDIEVGSPIYTGLDDVGCNVHFEWRTKLACPPNDNIPCGVHTSNGYVDLSSLSLPDQNYQVAAEDDKVFVLNVCRSLVHNNYSHCPYSAAACLSDPVSKTGDLNLGELAGSPVVSSNQTVYITYTTGAVCTNPHSRRTHIQTSIYFTCQPGRFDPEPEFLELSDCEYMFEWKHSAACPQISLKNFGNNCSVTSPLSGFTFDLQSLAAGEDGKSTWSHHIQRHSYVTSVLFNICGPLPPDNPCGPGVGACVNNKTSYGLANSNLTFSDGELNLIYSGTPCQADASQTSKTRISFLCPPKRTASSGNSELAGPGGKHPVVMTNRCDLDIEFFTDLACNYQVYCDVKVDDVVFPLTKLRRHDNNYQIMDKNKAGNFSLNICGPLVVTDVPSSACNPQGVCGFVDGKWVGLGKVLSPPRPVANGHVDLVYEDGELCSSGRRWRTRIVFTCLNHTLSKIHPLGSPLHVSTDKERCEVVFRFPTILACKSTVEDYKEQESAESCRLYHPERQENIDISKLYKRAHYKVYNPNSKLTNEYFEIQPCGAFVSSCNASLCRVEENTGRSFSLGVREDVKYYPNTGEVAVRFVQGEICNTVTGERFKSKIYFSCDYNAFNGTGYPELKKALACMVIFDWRTNVLCPGDGPSFSNGQSLDVELTTPVIQVLVSDKVKGGSSWGPVILALLVLVALGGIFHLYRNGESRGKVLNFGRELRAKLPVFLGGRRREDASLLVSGLQPSNMGSISDDEDI